jgi:hypothetical protein
LAGKYLVSSMCGDCLCFKNQGNDIGAGRGRCVFPRNGVSRDKDVISGHTGKDLGPHLFKICFRSAALWLVEIISHKLPLLLFK